MKKTDKVMEFLRSFRKALHRWFLGLILVLCFFALRADFEEMFCGKELSLLYLLWVITMLFGAVYCLRLKVNGEMSFAVVCGYFAGICFSAGIYFFIRDLLLPISAKGFFVTLLGYSLADSIVKTITTLAVNDESAEKKDEQKGVIE